MSLRFGLVVALVAAVTLPTAADQTPAPPAAPPVTAAGIIRGVVTAVDSGRPIHRAQIFAEDATRLTPRSLSIAAARPDQQGRFTIRGVPPGRYLIAAVDYLEPGQERDSVTLERLRRQAMAITLSEAESRSIDLKLAP